MPSVVELDDLVQAGMVGLLEAAQRYADTQHASFATFAAHRIRGAILDYTRQTDWCPRLLRRRLRDIEAARRGVELQTCGAAKAAAIAEALGLPLEVYYRTLRDGERAQMLSLDEVQASDLGGESIEPLDEQPGPEQELEQAEALNAAQAGIDALPDFERSVVALSYGEQLLLREIGAILALSESRVCQIRKRIIRRLRMAARG